MGTDYSFFTKLTKDKNEVIGMNCIIDRREESNFVL